MGEAKRRGTFEQRKAEGVSKREAILRGRLAAYAERLAAMPPEQRERMVQARMLLAAMRVLDSDAT